MNSDDKLARNEYAIYILNELLECDRETLAEYNGKQTRHSDYLKGRINGYETAIESLTL